MKKILLTILLVSSFGANAQFWTEKATGFATPNRSLNSISIVDANVIWANAFDNSDLANPIYNVKEFTLSIDGGNTWSSKNIDLGIDNALLGVSSITAISDMTAWVSVFPDTGGSGGIWKTIDGGTNWTKQSTALFNSVDSYPNFVYFWDANNGIAQGDPESGEFEIYTTSNGGTNWTRVSEASLSATVGVEWGYFNLYSVSGDTIWFGTNTGRLIKSGDKGLTWVAYQTPSTSFMLDNFTFSDANKGLLTIYQDPILLYKTIDGGANWSPVARSGPLLSDIAYIPGTSTVVSTDYGIRVGAPYSRVGSSYSTDDGVTWTDIDIDLFPHGTLAFLNDSFGFSSGFNTDATSGGIFKFTGIPLKAPSFDLKKQIFAYPNPTNGILHLDSESSSIKGAAVFDLLGRQVYSSKFSALNKVDLDLNSLQTGNYVLKVTSDSGKTETMKIMKN